MAKACRPFALLNGLLAAGVLSVVGVIAKLCSDRKPDYRPPQQGFSFSAFSNVRRAAIRAEEEGNLGLAEQLYRRSFQLKPSSREGGLDLGRVLLAQGKRREALVLYRRAAKPLLDAGTAPLLNREALFDYADLCREAGDEKEARRAYLVLRPLEPGAPQRLNKLAAEAHLFEASQRVEYDLPAQLQRHLKQALALDPNSPLTKASLAEASFCDRRPEVAWKLLAEAKALTSPADAKSWSRLALQAYYHDREAEGMAMLTQVRRRAVAERSVLGLSELGIRYLRLSELGSRSFRLGLREQARELAGMAKQSWSPGDAEGSFALAKLIYSMGQRKEAVDVLRASLKHAVGHDAKALGDRLAAYDPSPNSQRFGIGGRITPHGFDPWWGTWFVPTRKSSPKASLLDKNPTSFR